MAFETVFDIGQQGFAGWVAAYGMLFVPVVALLVFRPFVKRRASQPAMPGGVRPLSSRVILGFAACWIVAAFIATLVPYRAAVAALRDGHYSVVEGPVTDFVPMPYTGHAMERFSVQGQPFSYSDFIVTPGFRNSASHGGPIREGLYVRIAYVGNTILRLEVARQRASGSR